MKNLFYLFLISIAPIFLTAQTDGLHVVSPNGFVGVGTETPSAKLEVVGDTKTQGAIIRKTSGSASVSCEKVNKAAFAFGAGGHGGFTVDQNYHLEFRSNTRGRVLGRYITEGDLLLRFEKVTGDAGFGGITNPTTSIHTSGSITYNGALYNASDERLKRNISEMTYGLKEVLQLNPITFQYNGKGGVRNVEAKQFGLKAQNLQKVAPELVTTFTHQEENEETEVIKSEEYLMVEESAIKYMLVNAMKEQQEIIEDQAAMINGQTAMINGQATMINEQVDKLAKFERELAAIKELLTGKSSKNSLSESIDGSLLEKAQLGQNTPNPFDENTMIEYYLPKTVNNAQLAVYDNAGKRIKEINIETIGQGQVDLKLTNLAAGTYHYSLIVDGKIQDSKKMILK